MSNCTALANSQIRTTLVPGYNWPGLFDPPPKPLHNIEEERRALILAAVEKLGRSTVRDVAAYLNVDIQKIRSLIYQMDLRHVGNPYGRNEHLFLAVGVEAPVSPVLAHIKANPGCILRDIESGTQYPERTVRRHLYALQADGLIRFDLAKVEHVSQPVKAYFPVTEHSKYASQRRAMVKAANRVNPESNTGYSVKTVAHRQAAI